MQSGATPLAISLDKGLEETVHTHTHINTYIYTYMQSGATPLAISLDKGHEETVEFLMERLYGGQFGGYDKHVNTVRICVCVCVSICICMYVCMYVCHIRMYVCQESGNGGAPFRWPVWRHVCV